MFEGIYFEFPKLSFLLFVFLACDNLCPLRSQALYFPHLSHFSHLGVKAPAWMWISKWVMIVSLITAIMSPIKDVEQAPKFEGYSTLIALDSLTSERVLQIEKWCSLRPHDAIALYCPPRIKIPLTHDHVALLSMIRQIPYDSPTSSLNYTIKSFFPTHERAWIVIFSDDPKTFVHSLPSDIEHAVVPKKDWQKWMSLQNSTHPPIVIESELPHSQRFFIYPLFLGLLAMIVYLYGRNQKGLL